MKFKISIRYSKHPKAKTLNEIIAKEHWNMIEKELLKHATSQRDQLIKIIKEDLENKTNT